jgi:hypothetical protein
MSRRTPPQVVEVYYPGESTKIPSKVHMSYPEAEKAHTSGQGIFRDHRRKIVLATRPDSPSGGRSGCPGRDFAYRYVEAKNSGRARASHIPAVIVAADMGWGGKDFPKPQRSPGFVR